MRGRAADRRLHFVEIAPRGVRRKLVLLRRDDREHLVLLGANSDIVIESGIAAPRDADTRIEEREDRRSEEHTSELQSLMRISYAVFCLKKKKKITREKNTNKQREYIRERITVQNRRTQHN